MGGVKRYYLVMSATTEVEVEFGDGGRNGVRLPHGTIALFAYEDRVEAEQAAGERYDIIAIDVGSKPRSEEEEGE